MARPIFAVFLLLAGTITVVAAQGTADLFPPPSPPPPNALEEAYWTDWINNDRPGGLGDWELLGAMTAGQSCPERKAPTGIQCRRVRDRMDWSVTEEFQDSYICDPRVGGRCSNDAQADACEDFEIRLRCGGVYDPDFSGVLPELVYRDLPGFQCWDGVAVQYLFHREYSRQRFPNGDYRDYECGTWANLPCEFSAAVIVTNTGTRALRDWKAQVTFGSYNESVTAVFNGKATPTPPTTGSRVLFSPLWRDSLQSYTEAGAQLRNFQEYIVLQGIKKPFKGSNPYDSLPSWVELQTVDHLCPGQILAQSDEDSWTPWINVDNPSGLGDWELLSSAVLPRSTDIAGSTTTGTPQPVCLGETPTRIQCRRVRDGAHWHTLAAFNGTYVCSTEVGGRCDNAAQVTPCEDFEIRVQCPPLRGTGDQLFTPDGIAVCCQEVPLSQIPSPPPPPPAVPDDDDSNTCELSVEFDVVEEWVGGYVLDFAIVNRQKYLDVSSPAWALDWTFTKSEWIWAMWSVFDARAPSANCSANPGQYMDKIDLTRKAQSCSIQPLVRDKLNGGYIPPAIEAPNNRATFGMNVGKPQLTAADYAPQPLVNISLQMPSVWCEKPVPAAVKRSARMYDDDGNPTGNWRVAAAHYVTDPPRCRSCPCGGNCTRVDATTLNLEPEERARNCGARVLLYFLDEWSNGYRATISIINQDASAPIAHWSLAWAFGDEERLLNVTGADALDDDAEDVVFVPMAYMRHRGEAVLAPLGTVTFEVVVMTRAGVLPKAPRRVLLGGFECAAPGQMPLRPRFPETSAAVSLVNAGLYGQVTRGYRSFFGPTIMSSKLFSPVASFTDALVILLQVGAWWPWLPLACAVALFAFLV
eukprot:jgi/Mesvir1/17603/Mv08833-RA.2